MSTGVSIKILCVSTRLRAHQHVDTIQLPLKRQSKGRKRGAGLLQEGFRLFDLPLRRCARFIAILHELQQMFVRFIWIFAMTIRA